MKSVGQLNGSAGEGAAYLDAASLARGFQSRELSPVEIAGMLLDRIADLDAPINSIVHVDREATLAMASASEARYRAGAPLSQLDGVPVTVKDLVAVAGMPLRRGSLARNAHALADADAPCVARLREAGAVILAKTATPEAGCKVVTRSPVHGVTRNPYDPRKTPGGSSGGASAALAMGFGPLAIGTDGAGSIRIPASATNVFGLKPTFGRVPAMPTDIDMPHSVIGPMSRTVADGAALLAVISAEEPLDPYAWPVPFALPDDLADPDLTALKIAVSPRLGLHAPLVDNEVDALIALAGPLLADAGSLIAEDCPLWPVDLYETFLVFWETGYAGTPDAYPPERRGLVDPLIQAVAARGMATDIMTLHRAMRDRTRIAAAAKDFFNRYDLLIGPVLPVPPYDAELDAPPGWPAEDWSWCPYTYPWSMTGQPAASVPIGFTQAGLPVGVQIIGRMGHEATILRAAAAIERRCPLHLKTPKSLMGARHLHGAQRGDEQAYNNPSLSIDCNESCSGC